MIESGLIKESLAEYPAQNTILSPNLFTAQPEAGLIHEEDFTPAYWIGWTSWEHLPASAHISRYELVDEMLTFTDVTRKENVDITYMSPVSSNLTPAFNNNNYNKFSENFDYWSYWEAPSGFIAQQTRYMRLFNKMDVNIHLFNAIALQFETYIFTKSSSSWSYGVLEASVSVEDILSGSFTASATLHLYSGINPGLSAFTVSDADVTGHVVQHETDTHIIRMCLQSFGVAGFFRTITTSGALSSYMHPRPVFRVHDDDGRAFLIGMVRDGAGVVQSSWRNGAAVVVSSSGAITSQGGLLDAPADTPSDIIAGGFVGSVTTDQIALVAGTHMIAEVEGNNFALCGTGRADYTRIVRMYTMDDIKRFCGFQVRAGTASADNTYATDEEKLYPLVVGNEFMGELISGTDERLQPWQIAGTALDPETDDYTEGDKPPYIPADPDDREKIGASIGFNTNLPSGSASGLFTLYALRQAHVSQLGAKLWSALNAPDQNFWQNLRFALGTFAETGSVDISAILDYISSIRVYPFPLVNLPGYTGTTSGAIRLGMGKIPLDLSSGGAGNVGVMGQYTGLIDAGSAYIPQHFEDFRDLESVTISVYLPYIGNVTLNPAEVTGCTISAQYAVDLTSGACVAYLLLSGKWGYYPIGIYNGTIGADIPLSASQGNRLFLRSLSQMIGVSSVLGSGLSGAGQAEDGAGFLKDVSSATLAAAAYAGRTTLERAGGAALTPPTMGSAANFSGFGAPQSAYLQIRRSQYAYTARSFPADTYGNRIAQKARIGTLSGFTQCINPDVSKIPAPEALQRSIKAKLESGVYI